MEHDALVTNQNARNKGARDGMRKLIDDKVAMCLNYRKYLKFLGILGQLCNAHE